MTSDPALHFPLHSAFLALPLTGEAKRRFAAIVESLEPFKDLMRFQHLQSPHLTLQFWPELMEMEYQDVWDESKIIADASYPFEVTVTGADTFHDRVLFLQIEPSAHLEAIRKRCPWQSDRPFSPHITLARIKHPDRFVQHKSEVMKILQGVRFLIRFDRLRLYAEVDRIKQTPIGEFEFDANT